MIIKKEREKQTHTATTIHAFKNKQLGKSFFFNKQRFIYDKA